MTEAVVKVGYAFYYFRDLKTAIEFAELARISKPVDYTHDDDTGSPVWFYEPEKVRNIEIQLPLSMWGSREDFDSHQELRRQQQMGEDLKEINGDA